jgi:hypothetical protein
MLIRVVRYNTYLLLLALLVSTGCQSPKSKERRQIATLRVHVEVFADSTGANEPVSIGRSSPITITIDKQTILTEADVSRAQVVEDAGGFTLHIQFDRLGTQILENHTASRPGSHLAIFSEFGRGWKGRWLAPGIRRRISTGCWFLPRTPIARKPTRSRSA